MSSAVVETSSKAAWLRSGALVYVLAIIAAMIGALVYTLRVQGVFACSAAGYGNGTYLAYCQATGFGDYDRGAIWLGLEPEVQRRAARADVLFVGSSRMQFAFSGPTTPDWFSRRAISYYLLGFTHNENVSFFAPLLARLQPRARAYVVNVDQFFDDTPTWHTRHVLGQDDVESRYRRKHLWQETQRSACSAFEWLCGDAFSIFRDRTNGSWQLHGTASTREAPVGDDELSGPAVMKRQAAQAERFIAALPVRRECVILTVVPSAKTPHADAAAIAAALGMELVAPRLEALRTFDSSHLDADSARRWSQAFLDRAGSRIGDCLGKAGPAG